MKKIELLLPAGNIEKMQYAIAYGADAVYLGISEFSLRSMKSGNIITIDNIQDAVNLAHNLGAKAYITLNIFAANQDIEKLPAFLEKISHSKPDGIVFSDMGFYRIIKKYCPDIPLHVSTQANTLNYEAVKFWQDLGAKRIILARELSLKNIEKISNKVPDIELEMLVHGSLCVSYSGRCLLSDYMTGNKRKSNQGNCVQPCRWKYKLVEETRPGQYFDVMEDDKGAYILNPKDLALIGHIPDLINAGISSFKIEGRTKSIYYVSMVARTYKKAINDYLAGKSLDEKELVEELSLVGNRELTKGFLLEDPDYTHYNYETSKGKAGATFLGVILDKVKENTYKVLVKNNILTGSEIELVTPDYKNNFEVAGIINSHNENVESGNTNDIIFLELSNSENIDIEDWQWGIIRSKER